MPAVAHRRQRVNALFQKPVRRLHIHHFAGAGITNRPAAANHQHARVVDFQRRIVEALAIILRPLKHNHTRREHIFIPRLGQIPRPELVADDTGLDQRRIKQVAAQHQKAGLLFHRFFVGVNHLAIRFRHVHLVFGHRIAAHGQRVAVNPPGAEQLANHARDAARTMKGLAKILAGRLAVDEQRHVVAYVLPILQAQLKAQVPRDRC